MNIVSNTTMREAEQQLFASGSMDSLTLMNRVIVRLAEVWDKLPQSFQGFDYCIVYAGHGNNAGDALGWAYHLNMPTIVRHVGRFSPESQHQLDILKAKNFYLGEKLPTDLAGKKLLILDALLGTGATGPLRPPYGSLVQELNELRGIHPASCSVAIDIPTGLESGGACVQADITACIGAVKEPLLQDEATAFVGRILPIALPEVALSSEAQVTTAEDIHATLRRRAVESYKNSVGHLHIIAGSRGYIGAAQLCAEAAIHAGAGLVTLYARPEVYDILAARLAPEIMLQRVESYADIDCSRADALLIGPGLGQVGTSDKLDLKNIIRGASCPLVIDADGLNLIAREQWRIPPQAVITPHEGEMRRLAGAKQGSRLEWAQNFVKEHPCTLLLKGARSLICSPSGISYNSTGGSFMANGGQGDCLAGVIAALLSQGIPAHRAACAGAWICGQAAERAWQQRSFPPAVTASQVIAHIQDAFYW